MKRPLTILLLISSIILHPRLSHAAWLVDGVAIATLQNDQSSPAILSDGAGGAIIAWSDARNGNNDIYAQRINATGAVQWTADGVALCGSAFDQDFPAIVSDGAGGAIVTWQDLRGGTFNDVYAQRINAAGAVQWTANGVVLCDATRGQTVPTIIADGSGGAIVTWQDDRSGGFNDIYAQRINGAGLVQWTANGVVICTASDDQLYPTLASDGSAGAIVAWQDLRSSTANDIYAQRINAAGVVQWTANGVVICTAAGGQFYPLVTSDGAGGAIVAWNDSRAGITNSDIYAQRVNSTGAVQWTGDGVALCTAADDQHTRMVTSDGAGGVIVAWRDRRSGGFDVYARRINAAGTPLWTGDGVAVCTAADEQGIPAIATDDAGGAIVTWPDNRGPNAFNIYAQRINASGTVQWTPNGVALCTAVQNQSSPAIAGDGGGGAIVAWQDSRSGNDDDIYAQRVPADGLVPTAVRPITPAASLSVGASYPNPFAAETSFNVTLRRESPVSVEVFDAAGRRVRSIDMGRMLAGATRLTFDGLDGRAHALPSGVYFYRVHAGSETVTRKMVIAR